YAYGAGLGLSLVREMLHALDGRVELSSVLGEGSTFRISVPRARPSEAQAPTSPQTWNIA
ncbi:MAG TPA: ATP-binding protein, partial [Polyangiaceae bacterium]